MTAEDDALPPPERNAHLDSLEFWAGLERERVEIAERKRLGLPTAQETFALMIRVEIAPALRAIGFTGSGRIYRLRSNSHLLAVGIQSSAWNTALEVRFTVNVAAAERTAWRQMQAPSRATERHFNPNVHQKGVAVERIGLLVRGEDYWWSIAAGGPTADTSDSVIAHIVNHAVPWLRAAAQSR